MTAIDPGRRPAPPATPVIPDLADAATRLTTVKVNLLPAEITDARRVQRVRRVAVAVVALLAVVLGAASFVARAGVGAAESDLAAADALSASLRSQQSRYSEVVTLQEQVREAATRLGRLTAGDLDWAPLLTAVAAAVPAGVTVAAIDAATEDSGAAGSVGGAPGGTGATTPAAGAGAPGTGGGAPGTGGGAPAAGETDPAAAAPVGVLTLTGNATGPGVVAAFVDALTGVTGLAEVVTTGVTTVDDTATSYSYGITAVVTTAAARPTANPVGGR